MRLLLGLLVALAAGPTLAADGKAAFQSECASCHTLGPHSTPAGPTLKGVMWRHVGDRTDFRYTAALAAVAGIWTPARLDHFLQDTQGFAPGTDMYFAIDDAEERRAIVDYLKTVK
jgi:cytochrome c